MAKLQSGRVALCNFAPLPLSILGLTPMGTATLAGVIISLLGTLAAALAIFELGREELGENGGLRAAFYFLIFPSQLRLCCGTGHSA